MSISTHECDCLGMSERFDDQNKPNSNLRKLLQERIEKVNPCCKLDAELVKRLAKLDATVDKLKRGENAQSDW